MNRPWYIFVNKLTHCIVHTPPQMVSLYRDPKGEKIFDHEETETQTYRVTSLSTVTDDGNRGDHLIATESKE